MSPTRQGNKFFFVVNVGAMWSRLVCVQRNINCLCSVVESELQRVGAGGIIHSKAFFLSCKGKSFRRKRDKSYIAFQLDQKTSRNFPRDFGGHVLSYFVLQAGFSV